MHLDPQMLESLVQKRPLMFVI